MKFSNPILHLILVASSLRYVNSKENGRMSKKGTKGRKDKPRKRNNIPFEALPPGPRIGRLVKRFEAEIESWAQFPDGEDFEFPQNQIFKRCGPFPKYDVNENGEIIGPTMYAGYNGHYKGGCTGGVVKGEFNGLYLAGSYLQSTPASFFNFPQYSSDINGGQAFTDFWNDDPVYSSNDFDHDPFKDNSVPGTPQLKLQKGDGWFYTDLCTAHAANATSSDDKEWIHFDTMITSINPNLYQRDQFTTSMVSLVTNMYVMNKEKSHGCEGYFVTMVVVGSNYLNPRSDIPIPPSSGLKLGVGCPPGACKFYGALYEAM